MDSFAKVKANVIGREAMFTRCQRITGRAAHVRTHCQLVHGDHRQQFARVLSVRGGDVEGVDRCVQVYTSRLEQSNFTCSLHLRSLQTTDIVVVSFSFPSILHCFLFLPGPSS